jgi:hypothetical protein
MAYVPDVCWEDAKKELVSERGEIRHAAFTLYGYYCKLRNKNDGICFPKIATAARDTGIPKSNVSQLNGFLIDVGWIDINGKEIRPLKGFYEPEEIFQLRLVKLLLNRTNGLLIRTNVLLIRTLFKGTLNQPIKPAHLTSFSADSPSGESASQSADKNFAINLPETETGSSAAKADAEPPKNVRINSNQTDDRKNHPAIQMVHEISGRYPHKDQWDKIIRDIGSDFDIEFFRASWQIWRSFDGKPTNLQGWLFQPNERGKPPEIFGRENPGKTEEPPEKSSAEEVSAVAEDYQDLLMHCPDCFGFGSKAGQVCKHENLLEILERESGAGTIDRDLFERFKSTAGDEENE